MPFTAFALAVSAVFSLTYGMVIKRMFSAWKNLKVYKAENTSAFVTVVICMRNESRNIIRTLSALALQDYPVERFEVIVSDDFSEDHSVELSEKFILENRLPHFRILRPSDGQMPGKKNALAVAVKNAKGHLIAMTDGDCVMGPEWLSTLVSHHLQANAELTTGPVRLTGNSFFHQMQRIEFMSLSGVTGSAIQLQKPLMVNAANMIFNRESFIEYGRMNPDEISASGDDTYFMLQIAARNPAKISFCKDEKAIAETPAITSLMEFINQRVRWASKTRFYPAAYIKSAGLFLFLIHFFMLVLLMLAIVQFSFIIPLAVLFISKMTADAWLLLEYNRFYKINAGFLAWAATMVIYPFYMTIIPLLTLKQSYVWKGRKHKV